MKSVAFFLSFAIASLAHAQLSNQYPTSPASTTTNAFSLWGDSTGGSLLNTSLLLDSSAMGSGTLTLKPTTGSTNRTFTFPDKSGTPVMNNVSDTFGTTFLAESLIWFNNSDTSKRMTFDMSDLATATTVNVKAPLVSGRLVVDIAPNPTLHGSINFDSTGMSAGKTAKFLVSGSADETFSFPSGGGTVLTTSTTSFNNLRINNLLSLDSMMDITDYFAVNGFDPASPGAFDLRVWQRDDDLYIKRSSGVKVNVSGTVAETRGGTNQTTYTLGDLLYSSAANTLSKLAGNTTTTKKFLTQTGNGTISAAPVWTFPSTSDVAEGANLYHTDARAIAAPLTGYAAASGTISASDTVLGGIQKLAGNSQAIRLSSNFTTTIVTNTNTGLSFTAAANDVWHIRYQGTAQCSSTGGVKYQVTAPTGATVEGWLYSSTSAITTLSYQRITAINTLTSTAIHTVGTTPAPDQIDAIVVVGATGGTIAIGAASVTNAQTTTILANSSLKIEKL
jgi:hypothetical protein